MAILLIDSIAVSAVLIALLWYLLIKNYKPYLLYFALATFCFLLSILAIFANSDLQKDFFFVLIRNSLRVFGAFFILGGIYSYLGKSLSRAWVYGAVPPLLWVAATSLAGASIMVIEFLPRLYVGLLFLYAGSYILVNTVYELGLKLYLFSFFVLWGGYIIISPLIPSIPYIGGILGLLLAIGFMAVTFRDYHRKLLEEEKKFTALFHHANDAVFLAEVDDNGATGNFIEVNDLACAVLGYSKEELYGLRPENLIRPEKHIEVIQFTREPARNEVRFETEITCKDGREIPVEVNTNVYQVDGRKMRMGIVRDISERKKTEEDIRYLSFHDKLTGLYNRAYFEQELSRLDTPDHLPLSIGILDLNGLKFTNDVFGHYEGDKLLVAMAEVLIGVTRDKDVAARWGGDEFIFLLPRTGAGEAKKICEDILSGCRDSPLGLRAAVGFETKTEPGQSVTKIIKAAEDDMYRRKYDEGGPPGDRSHSEVVSALIQKSHETEDHISRMQQMIAVAAPALQLTPSDTRKLEMLAVLHDIGKIAIADEMLIKPGKLTSQEWETMKKHAEIGFRITRTSPGFAEVAECVLSHHERWDGKGYPHGLRKKEIPLLARILAVLDAFDAMTNDRPYRGAVTPEEAIEELRRNAGTQFDPEIVDLFARSLTREKLRGQGSSSMKASAGGCL